MKDEELETFREELRSALIEKKERLAEVVSEGSNGIYGLNKKLRSAIIKSNDWSSSVLSSRDDGSRVKNLLEQGANPFYKIGTTDCPIYIAAECAPNLVPILLEPKYMAKEYKYQEYFERVKNTYLLTAMMGTLSNEHRPNVILLKELLGQYKGDLSEKIPFFSDRHLPKGLIFAASECYDTEPLEILISCGAKDVKVNWDCKNYGIQQFVENGPLLRVERFLKTLALFLKINPDGINEDSSTFNGTCLDFFANKKKQVELRYVQHLKETIQMLVDAGGKAKPETWGYFRKRFGIIQKTAQPEEEKSLTYLHAHKSKIKLKNRFNQPPNRKMCSDISDNELLNSSFGKSIANRYRKA